MGKVMKMSMVFLATIAVMLVQGVTSETLTVGDGAWIVPTTPDYYSLWAADQTFAVDDILVFNIRGTHTVAQTTKEAYEACDVSLDAEAIISDSTAEIALTKEGAYYFFCTIGSHCESGQKLTVTVPSQAMALTPEGSAPLPASDMPPESPKMSSALRVSGLPASFMVILMSLAVLAIVIT